jgi:soluble lytic murein transglycosylase-like protein
MYDVDPWLVKAIIEVESNYRPLACSRAGARGLMQLMPRTAARLGVKDIYDPEQNIAGGTRYIKAMLDHFNNDPQLAIAAYNAGPGSVQKYKGIPPYQETQRYVVKVLNAWGKK